MNQIRTKSFEIKKEYKNKIKKLFEIIQPSMVN